MTISKKIMVSVFVGYVFAGSVNAMDSGEKQYSWPTAANGRLYGEAELGATNSVREILRAYPNLDVNAKGPFYGETALDAALAEGHPEVVEVLVDAGAEVNKDILTRARFSKARNFLEDTMVQREKSRVFALEALAKKDGDVRGDGTQKPFNVMSLLPRELRTEVEEFATCDCLGYEGRGLGSERLNIERKKRLNERSFKTGGGTRKLLEHINAKANDGKTMLDRGLKGFLEDVRKQHGKSIVLVLESLAKKDGDMRGDGTQKPFNVVSLLKRPLLQEVEEFATCDCPGYEGRGLGSERLNIEYAAQQKKEE